MGQCSSAWGKNYKCNLNAQGKVMNTPAFDAKRFVRPALRSIAFCLSVVLISSMMTVKPAYASGVVSLSQNWATNLALGIFCPAPSLSASVACFAQFEIQNPGTYWVDGYCHTPVSTVLNSATTATYTFSRTNYPDCVNPHINTKIFQVWSTACPLNSMPTGTTCTCNDGYAPDPTQTKCIPEQYTIALSGLGGIVMPNDPSKNTYATVTKNDGTPKSGVQVNLMLTVVPENDGLLFSAHVGSISPNGGSTEADGRLNFTFTAPVAGGIHTITATCANCSNQATGTIKVPGCPVPPLTTPPFNEACATVLENISSTQAQKDAACGALTDKLKTGMACFRDKLSGMSPAIPLSITSDIRSVAYQAHFREIWDKMQALVALEDDPAKRAACSVRRAEIAGRCTSCYAASTTQRSHCLKARPANPSPNDAQHTQGKAFDVSEASTYSPLQTALDGLNPPQNIQQFLNAPTNCNLTWGGTFINNIDLVHFYAP
jgi:hypothetical protein